MKKKLYYILAVVGIMAVVLSAMASDGGAGLQYTVAPAIIGCLMAYVGMAESRRIEEQEKRARRVAARRRSMKLIKKEGKRDAV